jgi:hypothetical protein
LDWESSLLTAIEKSPETRIYGFRAFFDDSEDLHKGGKMQYLFSDIPKKVNIWNSPTPGESFIASYMYKGIRCNLLYDGESFSAYNREGIINLSFRLSRLLKRDITTNKLCVFDACYMPGFFDDIKVSSLLWYHNRSWREFHEQTRWFKCKDTIPKFMATYSYTTLTLNTPDDTISGIIWKHVDSQIISVDRESINNQWLFLPKRRI